MKYAFALILCSSVLVAAAASYATVSNYAQALIMFVICIFSFSMVYMLYRASRSVLETSEFTEELMRSIRRISYYHSSNISMIKSAQRAADASSRRDVSLVLRKAVARMKLGEDLFEAILSSIERKSLIYRRVYQYIGRYGSTIEEALYIYESKRKESASRNQALYMRHSTYNMFLSTVAPSFIIFSFIGSMLISGSAISGQLMSVALIAGIPIAYAMSNSMLSRRLYE